MDLYSQISADDLYGDMKLVYDVCGIESVQKLLRALSGVQIYIPKISSFDNFILDFMRKNKNKSIKQIATELKVSEQHIRNVIKRNKK
jgi:Mor family transcriptional regulator